MVLEVGNFSKEKGLFFYKGWLFGLGEWGENKKEGFEGLKGRKERVGLFSWVSKKGGREEGLG